MKLKEFFINMVKGAVIGVAMIIPGVSGGTLAVIMNVYNKLIDAISNLRKQFKESFMFLLPILLGAVIAVCAVYFPLKLALEHFPFPTVMLFLGLMIGSCPKILKDGIKAGFGKVHIISFLIPLAVVIGICFIPGLGEADLSVGMPVYGYFLIILIGAVASCALVVPGISGSMLLFILGYYNSILGAVSDLRFTFGHSLLVLFLFAVGLIIGFFSIAKLMKLLLNRFPKGTMWAIIGFVAGSLPAILITYNGNFPDKPFSSLGGAEIAVGIALSVVGILLSLALIWYLGHKQKKSEITEV